MGQVAKNRSFVLNYLKTISGVQKTKDLLQQFTDDPGLIGHILFFEKLCPAFEVIVDEVTAEDDRVIVRARMRGRHTGVYEKVAPSHRMIEAPFAIGYRVENKRITDHWLIADQIELMNQLGLTQSLI